MTLAATLAVVPKIPLASLALLVGIDRFMSECRAITNLIGNGVATVVISRWEGEVTAAELKGNFEAGRRGHNESSLFDLPICGSGLPDHHSEELIDCGYQAGFAPRNLLART